MSQSFFSGKPLGNTRRTVNEFIPFHLGIPLPGTGAWSGSLVASILQFKYKDALLSILLGIILAAIIMTIGCYGTIGLFKLFI